MHALNLNKDRSRIRRGESGLGGIGACALSGIVSASWNVSLASESSSESKAVSLGREDSRTGALSYLGVSGGGFSGEGTALTFAVFPDEPDADKSLTSLAEVHSPPVVVAVGLSSAELQDGTVGRLGSAGSSVSPPRYGMLQYREVGYRR